MKRAWSLVLVLCLLLTALPLSIAADTVTLGDVDGNRIIEANDALQALQQATAKIIMTADGKMAADVNQNGRVEAADALLILQYATKKITSFTPDKTVIRVAGIDGCWFDRPADDPVSVAIAEVEKELNCEFEYTEYQTYDLNNQVIAAAEKDEALADVLVTTLWQQKGLMQAQVLQDVHTVNGLDTTAFDQKTLSDMALFNKNFFLTTTPEKATHTRMLFFNKRLAKQALDKLGVNTKDDEEAGEKLYEMVENGTWTFDQMQKISAKAAQDLTGDGKMDDRTAKDQYGFSGVDMRGGASYSIFKAKGGYFTKTTSDGTLYYALSDAINIVALKTMQTWLLKDISVYSNTYGNDDQTVIDAFTAGRVLFLGWTPDGAEQFSDMKDDWGILPYPKADAESSYVSTTDWNMHGFSIEKKADNPRTAAVLTALGKKLAGVSAVDDSLFRDETSGTMMKQATDTASIEHAQFTDLSSGGISTLQYLFDNVANDPAQRVKDVMDKAHEAFNAFLEKVKTS